MPPLPASTGSPASAPADALDAHDARIRALARLLDSAIRVPGTDIRFGLDPILGLFPGVGDMAAGLLSAYVILLGWRAGAPTSVLLRMLGNVGLDALVGAVPVLGDLFDVGFKANVRNVALLDRWRASPTRARRASRLVVASVIAVALLAMAGAVWLAVEVLRLVIGALGGA
ncbi:MAG TPA: DUF4112 domain-containing protein [Gemmatimonadaceae bacterium]|nr:DUF4112 domain-containing protein [Gemmatimonadaceae bacterium]